MIGEQIRDDTTATATLSNELTGFEASENRLHIRFRTAYKTGNGLEVDLAFEPRGKNCDCLENFANERPWQCGTEPVQFITFETREDFVAEIALFELVRRYLVSVNKRGADGNDQGAITAHPREEPNVMTMFRLKLGKREGFAFAEFKLREMDRRTKLIRRNAESDDEFLKRSE